MPLDPVWARAFIDKEVGQRFVADLDVQTPGRRVFIDLPVAQPISNDAWCPRNADARATCITLVLEVHEPSRLGVPEHAQTGAILDIEPEFKVVVLVEVIECRAELFDGLDSPYGALKRHGRWHVRPNVRGNLPA